MMSTLRNMNECQKIFKLLSHFGANKTLLFQNRPQSLLITPTSRLTQYKDRPLNTKLAGLGLTHLRRQESESNLIKDTLPTRPLHNSASDKSIVRGSLSSLRHSQEHVQKAPLHTDTRKNESLSENDLLAAAWQARPLPFRIDLSSPAAFVNSMPKEVQPYLRIMRIDKPIGSWLYFWPFAWSIAMASEPGLVVDPFTMGMAGILSVLIRGAGCTVNDIFDQDFDKMVERTKDRPIPAGDITTKQATALLAAQSAVILAILSTVSNYCVLLGLVQGFLAATYPLMKRITYWPQLYLGIAINWGVPLGFSIVQGGVDMAVVIPLYASTIAWSLFYDTIYAHQDKKDDVKAGVKSTALALGNDTKKWLAGFSGTMVASLLAAGICVGQAWPYYTAVGLVALHLGNQVHKVNLDDPKDCWKKFVSSKWIGVILFVGTAFGRLLSDKKNKEVNKEENQLQLNE